MQRIGKHRDWTVETSEAVGGPKRPSRLPLSALRCTSCSMSGMRYLSRNKRSTVDFHLRPPRTVNMDSRASDPEKANQTTGGSSPRGGLWAVLLRPFRGNTSAASGEASSTPAVASQTSGAAIKPDQVAAESSAVPETNVQSAQAKDKAKGPYTKVENDAACSKLLNIYIDEAERYDKALVESWKNDMTALLIFSGLFSASLTAFIVESYKTLQPDPADKTVALLTQISLQLPALATGQISDSELPAPFQVTRAALACNILWFISLALSLTCSLLATLVDQWAREFLHKTEIRPAPVVRARTLSFLYRGLQDFHMHAVVDVIPFLLHFSLFLFFGGLVPFLLPISLILALIVAVILGIFLGLYSFLTVLPVVQRACPYSTPLSGVAWKLMWYLSPSYRMLSNLLLLGSRACPSLDGGAWKEFKQYLSMGITTLKKWYNTYIAPRLHRASHAQKWCSMTDTLLNEASENSRDRDVHAVQWTLKNLTDDRELLPFVEAIPELVYGHNGFRRDNDHLILPLLNTSDPQLSISRRVVDLLRRSQSFPQEGTPGTLTRQRIQTACLKAIWAIGMVPNLNALAEPHIVWFDKSALDSLRSHVLEPYYVITARAAIRYSWLSTIMACIPEVRNMQDNPDSMDVASLRTIREMVKRLTGEHRLRWNRSYLRPLEHLETCLDAAETSTSTVMEAVNDTMKAMTTYRDLCLLDILVGIVEPSLRLESCPYEYASTCQELLLDKLDRLPNWAPELRASVSLPGPYVIPDPSKVTSMTVDFHDIDIMVMLVLQIFHLTKPFWAISASIIRYITKRQSDRAISYILQKCDLGHLRSVITQCFWVRGKSREVSADTVDNFLETGIFSFCETLAKLEDSYEAADDSLYRKGEVYKWAFAFYPFVLEYSSNSLSTISLVSHYLLVGLEATIRDIDPLTSTDTFQSTMNEIHQHLLLSDHLPHRTPLNHSLHDVQAVRRILCHQLGETRLSVLSRFLMSYSVESIPQEGLMVVELLSGSILTTRFDGYNPAISSEVQRAFANGVRNLMQCHMAKGNDAKLEYTIDKVWETINAYKRRWLWFDDVTSAAILAPVLERYCRTHIYNARGSNELYVRCLQVLKSATHAAEEIQARLLQDEMLTNFIQPAFLESSPESGNSQWKAMVDRHNQAQIRRRSFQPLNLRPRERA